MSLRNVELQTVALHVGSPNYALVNTGTNIPLPKAGVLTNPGISIFGDAIAGEKATVTIYPPHKDSKQSSIFSLYVNGDSGFIGDISQTGNHSLKGNSVITGNLTISGTMKAGFATWSSSIVATSKLFDIKHPSKENYRLAHASLEGPEIGVYYRGRLTKSNTIELPHYWKNLVHEDSITVSVQPIGVTQKIVVMEFDNEKITLSGNIDCFYHVYGERKDVDKLKVEYEGDTIMEQGKPK